MHQPTPKTYQIVFVVLLALLVCTVAAAFVDLDRVLHGHGWSLGIALSIAVLKGLFIVLYFMHVRYGMRLTWAFAGAGFLWLGILAGLTLSDYLTRNHPPGLNFKGEPRYLSGSAGE